MGSKKAPVYNNNAKVPANNNYPIKAVKPKYGYNSNSATKRKNLSFNSKIPRLNPRR